jgi:hypothetical protein
MAHSRHKGGTLLLIFQQPLNNALNPDAQKQRAG